MEEAVTVAGGIPAEASSPLWLPLRGSAVAAATEALAVDEDADPGAGADADEEEVVDSFKRLLSS